ncbi:MAG: hypothetical protein COX35_01395 [Candidatus Nealsonbacteria bacterium CG23_combo_of_CG06-09_8_20_14_all_37_18]|uniref:Septum formation initiator n=1 Tax=Candidatus Nealsonbacteria bacterium CG23_combo_of_CG06-09_8_20_14_all_37_18 TaxID=1974720 RepID=A0A2G9YYJ0_9BACT|nr:MAG: hypothetical protein COX35_01395 [Candidatus Nealsonbacteria bacterium CG23_combo_of_CG06-09_8_20_14_all_37_18]
MLSKNRKIKKAGNSQDIFFPILIGIFLLAIVGFLVVSNLKINQKRGELTDRIEELKKEIRLLSEKNEQLKTGILQTESAAYWEARLYEQGYKKPGEEAIVVLPPEGKNETAVPKEKNFWENLLEKIGF